MSGKSEKRFSNILDEYLFGELQASKQFIPTSLSKIESLVLTSAIALKKRAKTVIFLP